LGNPVHFAAAGGNPGASSGAKSNEAEVMDCGPSAGWVEP
jgi:hypothetical protein